MFGSENRLYEDGIRKELTSRACKQITEKVQNKELDSKIAVINYIHDSDELNLKEKLITAMYMENFIERVQTLSTISSLMGIGGDENEQ